MHWQSEKLWEFCVAWWHLVLVRAFGVMHDQTEPIVKKTGAIFKQYVFLVQVRLSKKKYYAPKFNLTRVRTHDL